MTTRFSPYGKHQPFWWMHTRSSQEFKNWYLESEYNRALFKMFMDNPNGFLDYIKDSCLENPL